MAACHQVGQAASRPAVPFADVALRLYPWPPSYAFLRSCMIDAYATALHDLPEPVVDLGCGDGRFATVLIECRIIRELAAGLDRDPNGLREASSAIPGRVVAGDLLALPFEGECAGTVMCNTVLNCLSNGHIADLDVALSEINRLLRPGGRFVCCVHTSVLAELHFGHRLLSALGLRTLDERYLKAIHRSNGRTIHLTAEEWEKRLQAAGLMIERAVPFFTVHDSRRRRVLRLLRCVPSRSLTARACDRLIRGRRTLVPPVSGPGRPWRPSSLTGYVLIVARKPTPSRGGARGEQVG
jgi:ubiquinone/menaquinone biosynthesis C-methylase UbiE